MIWWFLGIVEKLDSDLRCFFESCLQSLCFSYPFKNFKYLRGLQAKSQVTMGFVQTNGNSMFFVFLRGEIIPIKLHEDDVKSWISAEDTHLVAQFFFKASNFTKSTNNIIKIHQICSPNTLPKIMFVVSPFPSTKYLIMSPDYQGSENLHVGTFDQFIVLDAMNGKKSKSPQKPRSFISWEPIRGPPQCHPPQEIRPY